MPFDIKLIQLDQDTNSALGVHVIESYSFLSFDVRLPAQAVGSKLNLVFDRRDMRRGLIRYPLRI